MNVIKQLMIKPKIRKRVRTQMQDIIKQSQVKDYDVKFVKDMENAMINIEIAHMDISAYPLHQRLLDRINEIIDAWIAKQRAKADYYRSLANTSQRSFT